MQSVSVVNSGRDDAAELWKKIRRRNDIDARTIQIETNYQM